MKIAYLLNSRVPSDNAHVIQTLHMCNGFAEAGHQVTLFYPDREQPDPGLERIPIQEYYDISVRFDVESVPYLDMNTLLQRLLGRTAPQFVFSRGTFTIQAPVQLRSADYDLHYTRGTYVAFALVALGLPTVLGTHRDDFGDVERRLLKTIADRESLRGVVTLTDAGKRALTDLGFPDEKVQVQPDAVSLDRYTPQLSVAEARAGLDISVPSDRSVVGYTGSLTEGKGVYDLVTACSDLNVELVVVGGDESDREQLRTFATDRDVENLRLAGRVAPAAVPRYQQAMDILALAPRRDVETHRHHPEFTSPLKLFEYMAAARPVVGTRLPGIEAVVAHEETGILVPPGDPEQLHGGIERLATDAALRDSVGRAARTAVESHTWSRRAANVVAGLNSL